VVTNPGVEHKPRLSVALVSLHYAIRDASNPFFISRSI
jgi:hypothetical protein